MGIVNINKFNTSNQNKQSQSTQERQPVENTATRALNASPNPPQATAPIEEQAKEKLTTTGFFKAIYAKDSMFSKKFDNLELDNLKYIFDDKAVDDYLRMSGNELKKSSEFKQLSGIKNSLPDMMVV